ncbi:hypothetical protein D3C86_1646020 [compost metagenome]
MFSQYIFNGGSKGTVFFFIGSLYFLRTMSMGGLLMLQYYQFFSTHSYTFYSHIRVLRNILDYPYKLELGQEIGVFFYNDETMNANANFWATDGIAAMGLPGVILISIVMSLVLYFMDCISKSHSIKFVVLFLVFNTLSLLNASLFTTLFSGGLMFVFFILYIMPIKPKNEI